MNAAIINANALHLPLSDSCVQCAITSPPYYGLRDYGVNDQIGLEPTPQEYVARIVAAMREVRRVLRPDGTLWIVLGDSFARNGSEPGGGNRELMHKEGKQKRMMSIPKGSSLKPKDLVGIPWHIAFALQADGWYLRSDIIWSKPNPMPESVTDRPTRAHEYVFLLAKLERYFYDADAIKEPSRPFHVSGPNSRANVDRDPAHGTRKQDAIGKRTYEVFNDRWRNKPVNGRNRRSVWTVATMPYAGAHFATFPPKLIEPMVLAGSRPGDLVLDPFAGTATVGRVCVKHGRRFVGVELNPAYIELSRDRTSRVQLALTMTGQGDG